MVATAAERSGTSDIIFYQSWWRWKFPTNQNNLSEVLTKPPWMKGILLSKITYFLICAQNHIFSHLCPRTPEGVKVKIDFSPQKKLLGLCCYLPFLKKEVISRPPSRTRARM